MEAGGQEEDQEMTVAQEKGEGSERGGKGESAQNLNQAHSGFAGTGVDGAGIAMPRLSPLQQ